ncbi:MAG: hypothetical protein PHE53_03725 [Thermoguttaceae bacterium]|nr:hypothetical protein [Thermoguttaceae bacterium]
MDATQLRSACILATIRGHRTFFSTVRRRMSRGRVLTVCRAMWMGMLCLGSVLGGIFGAFSDAMPMSSATAAQYATPNFVIQTEDATLAKQFAETAEVSRKELAVLWLGHNIPNWSRPCPVRVTVDDHLGAGGETSFSFASGEVYGWTMSIQGPADQIISSVLPHEITHMILASHFRKPLPRWADEGAASSIEHSSERQKLNNALIKYLQTNRGISFTRMFAMKEYPDDIRPLYAQAHALVTFLIDQGGHRKYIQFLETAFQNNNWNGALQNYYGFDDLKTLQTSWNRWVAVGMPLSDGTLLASNAPLVGRSFAGQPTNNVSNASATMIANSTTASSGVALASLTQNGGSNMAAPVTRSSDPNVAPADPYGGTRTAAARPRPEPNLVWNGPVEENTRPVANLGNTPPASIAAEIPVQGAVTGSISSSSAVIWNTSDSDSQTAVRELLSQTRSDTLVR